VTTRAGTGVEDLLRPLARRVLGVVVRRFGAFEAGEDAAQEALPAVARHWPEQENPDNPRRSRAATDADRKATPAIGPPAWRCGDQR
jgi:predicted RNA polymerase sigma factor